MTTLATFDVLLRANSRDLESGFKRAEGASNSFVKSIASTALGFGAATLAMAGLNNMLSLGKNALIGYNARMEQAEIGFTTLLGSATEAKAFVADLKQFAAETPFDFPGLQSSANLMMGMGFQAQEIIPTLTAVGDVMSSLGKTGSDSIRRVVYSFGQMKQMGRVTNMELRELAMMGVKVYPILGKAFNKTTDEIREMVNKGLIPAEEGIAALIKGINESNAGGMMAVQALTWTGAMSTIKDTAWDLIGNALKPLFNALRDILVPIATWMSQSKEAKKISNDIAISIRAVVIVLQNAAASFFGLGDSAEKGMKKMSTFSTIFTTIKNQLSTFTETMRTGGWNAIIAYGEGLWAGAQAYVFDVVSRISEWIASYFIGGSPPKAGPLSRIYAGGRAVIDAWVQGALSADLAPVLGIPRRLSASLKEVESATKFMEASMKSLDRQISLIDLNLAKLSRRAGVIRAEFEKQLAPLIAQLDLLRQTVTFADRQRDLGLELQRNNLESQLLAAAGNEELQKGIQAQLDAVNAQIQMNRLAEEHEALVAELNGIPIEEKIAEVARQADAALKPLEDQIKLLEDQRSILQEQRSIWQLVADDIRTAAEAMKTAAGGARGAGGRAKGAKESVPKRPPEPPKIPYVGKALPVDEAGMEKVAQAMATGFLNGFAQSVLDQWPRIMGMVIGAVVGFIIGGPWGAAIGAAVGGTFGSSFSNEIKGLGSQVSSGLGVLVESVRSFLSGGSGFGGVNIDLTGMIDGIATQLGVIGLNFISWVGDTIPLLLAELPKILGVIIDFVTSTLPQIGAKLFEWAMAFGDWVFTQAVPLLYEKLPGILEAVVNFIADMLPKLVTGGLKLGAGLVGNMIEIVKTLPGKLVTWFTTALGRAGDFVATIGEKGLAAGTDFVKGLIDEVTKLPGKVWDILVLIAGKVTSFAGKGIKAFGDLAGDLGRAFANGIASMIEGALNAIIRAINSFKIDFAGIDTPVGRIAEFHWGGFGLPLQTLPRFAKGAWDVPSMMPAVVDKGEMILPADLASKIRGLVDSGASRGGGVTNVSVTINTQTLNASEAEARVFARKMWQLLEDESARRGRRLSSVGAGG